MTQLESRFLTPPKNMTDSTNVVFAEILRPRPQTAGAYLVEQKCTQADDSGQFGELLSRLWEYLGSTAFFGRYDRDATCRVKGCIDFVVSIALCYYTEGGLGVVDGTAMTISSRACRGSGRAGPL